MPPAEHPRTGIAQAPRATGPGRLLFPGPEAPRQGGNPSHEQHPTRRRPRARPAAADPAARPAAAEPAADSASDSAADSATDRTADRTAAVIAQARSRIDELDRQIIALIRSRTAVSAEVQAARIAGGGARVSLARELEILARYRAELGPQGTEVAMQLLELCRGRAGAARTA
ncbi:chorismate mutase [Streptacidiphilus sp. 4-A2]|nr:chorismate mutase [Streptacidiphilus sp. 4-A2]